MGFRNGVRWNIRAVVQFVMGAGITEISHKRLSHGYFRQAASSLYFKSEKGGKFSEDDITMASYYDEIEVRASLCSQMKKHELTNAEQIEDMEFDEENLLFHSPCPCGDRFEISLVISNLVLFDLPATNCGAQIQLQEGEDIARCPSCSLIIRVIYDPVSVLGENALIQKDDFKEDVDVGEKDLVSSAVEIAA